MQYKHAATSSNAIWKYNALYHLIAEHSNGGILPEIPGELLVKIFIHKKGEQALGIGEEYTHGWRRENLIPDSEGLEAMMEDQQKREIRYSFYNFV
jgi:hypothetical protein